MSRTLLGVLAWAIFGLLQANLASAGDSDFKIEKIDPNASVSDALKDQESDCVVTQVPGTTKIVRICGKVVSPDALAKAKAQPE